MLLTSFLALIAVGLIFWILGQYFTYTGIAVVGAVLVIAAGATVMVTQLSVVVGQDITRDHTVVDNETVENTTSVEQVTRPIETQTQFAALNSFSIGALVTIVGGLLATRHLEEVAL
jgi:glucan phosphoethanolaminetransferase (alkaline phosphatase superfamily)